MSTKFDRLEAELLAPNIEALALTRKKMSAELTLDRAVSEIADTKMLKAALAYGPGVVTVKWSPNWNEGALFEVPSGFQFEVARNRAPVLPHIFSRREMFAGTMAVPLAGPTAHLCKTGAPLTRQYLEDPKNRVLEKLDKYLPDFTVDDSYAKQVAMGSDSGNYAGLFMTTERTAQGHQKQFWAVASTASERVSAEFHQLAAEAAPDDYEAALEWMASTTRPNSTTLGSRAPVTTWDQFFLGADGHDTTRVAKLLVRQKVHRAVTIANMLRAVGLGKPAASTDIEVLAQAIIKGQGTIDSIRNTVGKLGAQHGDFHNGNPVYLSDMTSTESVGANGLVLNENPLVGPRIIRGALNLNPEIYVAGFPAGVGSSHLLPSFIKGMSEDQKRRAMRTTVHTWDHAGAALNPLLCHEFFRSRDTPAWTEVEQYFSDVAARPHISLEPVAVKLSMARDPTPSPE